MTRSWWDALRFLGGAALVFAAAYVVSEVVDPVYPVLRARVAHFQQRASVVEAVAVGNSHGGVIEFDELGVRGMHFTSAGQDAFEGAYLVRHATSAPRLRYALFAASYGVTRKDHAVVGTSDMRARRRQLYARTPLQRPLPGDLGSWVGGMLAPVVRDDHWKGVLGRPIRARPPVRLAEDGRRIVPERRRPLGRDALVRYGARVGREHARVGRETIELAPGTPDRVAGTLDALARELRARGVALVLFTPPYHETYLRMQDADANAEAAAILGRVVAENPNAVWLDYSDDPRFTGRDELFNNSDHLNRAGGRLFSRLLGECLRAALAETPPGDRIHGCPEAPPGSPGPAS